MSVLMNGDVYYRTHEACQMANISRSTFLRWVRNGIVKDTPYRDRRDWRLFTVAYIQMLRAVANRVR
jgi:predicted site-specific integrase-resolvase